MPKAAPFDQQGGVTPPHMYTGRASSQGRAGLLKCKQARKHAVGIDAVTPLQAQHEF